MRMQYNTTQVICAVSQFLITSVARTATALLHGRRQWYTDTTSKLLWRNLRFPDSTDQQTVIHQLCVISSDSRQPVTRDLVLSNRYRYRIKIEMNETCA